MNYYIEIENGVPKNHPALESNLTQAFGRVPAHWEPFVRTQPPVPTRYQVFNAENTTYQKVNGVWTDVWDIRDMTAEEKTARQQEVKNNWASIPNNENYAAWIFDEITCTYVAPSPAPTDRQVFWQGTTNSWVDLPQRPDDGKKYVLNIASATWVEV